MQFRKFSKTGFGLLFCEFQLICFPFPTSFHCLLAFYSAMSKNYCQIASHDPTVQYLFPFCFGFLHATWMCASDTYFCYVNNTWNVELLGWLVSCMLMFSYRQAGSRLYWMNMQTPCMSFSLIFLYTCSQSILWLWTSAAPSDSVEHNCNL